MSGVILIVREVVSVWRRRWTLASAARELGWEQPNQAKTNRASTHEQDRDKVNITDCFKLRLRSSKYTSVHCIYRCWKTAAKDIRYIRWVRQNRQRGGMIHSCGAARNISYDTDTKPNRSERNHSRQNHRETHGGQKVSISVSAAFGFDVTFHVPAAARGIVEVSGPQEKESSAALFLQRRSHSAHRSVGFLVVGVVRSTQRKRAPSLQQIVGVDNLKFEMARGGDVRQNGAPVL